MGPEQKSCKITGMIFMLAVACLPPRAGMAEPVLAPMTLTAQYEVDWSGIAIGRINLAASENAEGYRMVVDTKTSGIARLFSAERTEATIEGVGGLGTPYIPQRYESKPQKDSKGQHTIIRYDATSHIVELSRIPGDDPNWRPVVPREQANTATDPITAAFVLRQKLHTAVTENRNSAELRTYDGARLATMKLAIARHDATLTIMGKPLAVVDTTITRTPIAGYTPKEIKKFAQGDPPIHLYFSRDQNFLPVKVTIASAFGTINATLVRRD